MKTILDFTVEFQFHKVQLTPLRIILSVFYVMFQFHKVQLTQNSTIVIVTLSMFQFHKVQLTPALQVLSSVLK